MGELLEYVIDPNTGRVNGIRFFSYQECIEKGIGSPEYLEALRLSEVNQ